MGEPQKEPAATANTKNRSSLQDEDIGKDFFSSWKSMSVAEDDAMDFNYEPLPKGKKNAFSFDQLDMDFGLGGDFDKISSSFKVSMPDLDFSSPPNRLGKQNEKTGKENSSGKSEDKQDRSSFNFDFNAFDSFDLDSSLLKEEKKSEKGSEHAHANRSDSSPKHDKNQSVINNLVTGINALEGSAGSHDSVADGNPPASVKIGNLNALDNFDLDSSWDKGGKKSDKAPGSAHEKMLDSQCEHESSQSSRSNLAIRADAFDDSRSEKFTELKSATTSKIEHLIGGPTSHVSKIDSSPSTSANCENLNVSHVATSPEKEITSRTKVSDHFNRQSKMTDTTKPLSNHTTQDLFISSVHGNNVFQEAVPEPQEEFSFVPEVNTTKDGEQDGSAKPAAAFESRVSSSLTNIRGLQSTNNKFGRKLENKNVVPIEDTSCGASIEGHTDDKDVSVSSAAENTVCSKKLTKETTNSISKLLVAPTNCDPRISKHLQVRGKGTGHVSLKPLPRSDAAGAQVNTAPAQSKSCPLNDKRTESKSLSSVHERRLECVPGDAQAGDRRVSALKLPDSAGRKGVPITEECVKTSAGQTTSSVHVRPASLPELTTKSSDLRCTNPKLPALSIVSTKKVVSSSEVLNKTLDTSLKVSRPMIAKNDLQHSSLHRQIRSLKPTEVNKELHVREPNTASTVAAEKRGLLSPSLKRKTFEASSDAAPDTLYPSRSINESPSQNRKALKTSETNDKKLAPNLGSPLSGYRTSRFEPDTSMAEFEVPLTMENDGIVEKAEACAKELEDICNMLKKKHEEAKELLVRAIVNNNNLLMLNHPIYEEKIRSAQSFANRVMDKELEIC